MRPNIIVILAVGAMMMLTAACDGGSDVSGRAVAETDNAETVAGGKVGKALDGATPALPDKNEDMALIAKETTQNEVETAAVNKERDKDLAQIESEKISNQAPQETNTP